MTRDLKVLLGVSGGIAAIKAPEVVRRLRERGHAVRCAMTRSAGAFVAPLPLEVLSGHPVYREEYLAANDSGEELHLVAARWADVVCIAPATCNTLARLALGLADDFLSTTVLAFGGPLVLAPAMSTEMWSQEVVQQHVRTLRERGVHLVGPVVGPLASGEVGLGRMVEPIEIVAGVEKAMGPGELGGRTVLITAGPTREPIDAVRFLSNRSSGKMGYSLAAEAAARGARTLLVSGPVSLEPPPRVECTFVETAEAMERAVRSVAAEADIVIMTAAVADFRPHPVAVGKLKKRTGVPELRLEPTADILTQLAALAPRALRVGFAAETEDLEAEAQRKLIDKNADFIVANDVSRSDVGFESDENEVLVFSKRAGSVRIGRRSKRQIAAALFDLLAEALRERDASLVSTGR